MVSNFISFVKSNNIAIHDSNTLLAVSGGIDSVVLAHLFKLEKLSFSLAHCNFNLRGKESDKDEKFVKKLAKELRVEFHSISFNTTEIANKKGISIQMAARELRYTWFDKIRKEFSYDFIATAHHKGDVAETVLFNIAKGCGLEGLHGIKPIMGSVIRPMLFADRSEIKLFAKTEGVTWREDSSNQSVKYSRNKIRHQVVNVLEEINPKAQEAIYNLSKRITAAEEFLAFALKSVSQSILRKEGAHSFINKKQLMNTAGNSYVLFELLKPYNFIHSQINPIIHSINGISGKLFYSTTHILNIDRTELIISPLSDKNKNALLEDEEGNHVIDDFNFTTKTYLLSDYSITHNASILGLDKDKLTFPLEIRGWKKGDVFYPLGMVGKKKLSDFMIDAKIPVNLKDQIRVVVSGSKIAGILNYRLDRRFKIDEKTKTVFEITCK